MEQVARVVAALERRRDRVHGGVAVALARELRISQPALWQILHGQTKPSYGTAEALAQLEGVAVESILSSPRDRAAALAREAGISEAAIRRVMDEPESEPRPVLHWTDRMRAVALLDSVPPPPASSTTGAGPKRSAA